MSAPLSEPAASSDRDRRRLLKHAFVWLPTGLWIGALLVGLRAALELAARHRAVGTASAEEASILLWQTLGGLPALAWGAALAGPLVAALVFRFGRTPASRVVVTALGTGLATAGLAAQAWSRGRLGWRDELALDAPLVYSAAALLLVVGTVRVVDRGARLVGPLEDAPALLRPLLGGGPAAGGLLVLALALALPPSVATPPRRDVLLFVRDLLREPEAIQATNALGEAAGVPALLTPPPPAYRPAEPRRGLRWAPPVTLRFEVAEGASHLLADLAAVPEDPGAGDPTLSLRCDVLLDGVVVAREGLRVARAGELGSGGPGPDAWLRLGGPGGVPIAGADEVALRLERVGPSDPEVVGSPGGWVGFAPLAQVDRRSVRFSVATRARPSLCLVRLPRDADPPVRAWTISVGDGGFWPELAELATDLLRTGAATAALGPRPAGRIGGFGGIGGFEGFEGFEAHLANPAALDRWLETRAHVRSLLWVDLTDPTALARAGGAGRVLDRLRSDLDAAGSTVWVFFDDGGTTAHVGDFRHPSGLADAALSSRELREALTARVLGVAPSVAAAWERAAPAEGSGR